jgi:hypothetical protein
MAMADGNVEKLSTFDCSHALQMRPDLQASQKGWFLKQAARPVEPALSNGELLRMMYRRLY